MIDYALLDGMILMWFILTALSVLFIVIDIRNTPEDKVLKWGFILLTAYIGPFGLFLYVFGCREPLPGLHAQYVASRWRQVLGSTMHCVAGDGIGILVGAVIGAVVHISMPSEILLEYILGFGFGWTIFQALAMKAMMGTYKEALQKTFYSELVSMNWLMAGMMPVMMILMRSVPDAGDPTSPRFWFIMSLALLVGFIAAYPVNWWLVSRNIKHGMLTVRATEKTDAMAGMAHEKPAAKSDHESHDKQIAQPSNRDKLLVGVVSFIVLFAGISIGMAG